MNSAPSELLIDEQQGVVWLTFNRPHKANALSLPLLTEFNRALADAAARDDVRAVVVTGEGKAFCAGMDLKAVAADARAMGDLMFASHRSLQNDYEVSCAELDALAKRGQLPDDLREMHARLTALQGKMGTPQAGASVGEGAG